MSGTKYLKPRGSAMTLTALRSATEAVGDCWLWARHVDKYGYGRLYYKGKHDRAHRVAWEVAHGRPVPTGLTVDHVCFNRRCVNPEHLQLLSRAENSRRQQHALAPTCIKGHPRNTDTDGRRPSGQRVCRACERERMALHSAARNARRRARYAALKDAS